MSQMDTNPKQLIDQAVLRCPICWNIPLSNVYQCIRGHSVCDKCIHSLGDWCPTCRAPFGSGSTKIRNFALEAVLDEVIVPCPSATWGCSQKMKRNQIVAHDKICRFREVNLCHYLGYEYCGAKYRHDFPLIEHLKDEHSHWALIEFSKKTSIAIKRDDIPISWTKTLVKLMMIEFGGERECFLVVVKLGPYFRGPSLCCCAVIYVKDDEDDYPRPKAEDFMAKIDIGILQGQKQTHICTSTGPALHFKSVEDPKLVPYCSTTAMNFIESRVDPGTNFELIVNVEMTGPTLVSKSVTKEASGSDVGDVASGGGEGSQVLIIESPSPCSSRSAKRCLSPPPESAEKLKSAKFD